jgi:hypothetical protein
MVDGGREWGGAVVGAERASVLVVSYYQNMKRSIIDQATLQVMDDIQ